MLNSRLNDKLNIFDEIDKISKEITKQNSFKTTHYNSLYDTNNNSLNQQFNFANTQQYLNNNNNTIINNNTINNNDFQNSFNNYISKNNKIENLKESFSTNVNKDIISSKKLSQEENPEKFVFQFFYDNQELTTDNKQKKTTGNKGSHNIKYFRQNKYNTNNRPYNDINNQLMNYKSMLSRCNNYSIKDKKNKSKENNNKINKIIKKLYDGGLKEKRKKELLYEQNLMKKNEEYKKYSFYPNQKKKKKAKSNKNKHIRLSKLNENLYSKQIEWKNKKEKKFIEKKKENEEKYLKQFTFKPNLSQEEIVDDEKMIRRNINDMNNYIIKRRNQIRYKKPEGFILRDYNNSNNNLDYDINKVPLTERIYYRNKGGLNNTLLVATNKKYNCSKFEFLKAVKNLHDEINNLKI